MCPNSVSMLMEPVFISEGGGGVGTGVEGAGSKMYLIIKTGCERHRAAQMDGGQGCRKGETVPALVSEPDPSSWRLFLNITWGSS